MASIARAFILPLCLIFSVHSEDVPIPRYTINLDLPPEERWKDVALDFSSNLTALVDFFKKELGTSAYQMLAIMGAGLHQYYPSPYREEIMSYVKYANITVGEMVLWNMLDELTAFSHTTAGRQGCTSIVAQTESGQIIHGRNLDYSGPLRRLAVTVDFQQSGETLYTGTTFAGYVGLLTAQKPNHFTISQDDRYKGDWQLNVQQASILGTSSFLAFKIRDLLAAPDSDFEKVVSTLASTELIAPCYLIVGGLTGDEGAVITHNRTMGIDVWRLNSSEGRWFLVETNYDHWNPPPSDDNRRDPANKMMNTTGLSRMSSESLFKVLSTPPVLNWGTMFTTIMSASNPDSYYGYLRLP